jgi:hypothetical protein
MSEYILVVKIPLVSLDDPDARQKAQEILKKMKVPDKNNIKLQRLEQGKAPVGIALN